VQRDVTIRPSFVALAFILPLFLSRTATAESAAHAPLCDAAVRPWVRFVELTEKQPMGFSDIVRHVRAELDRKGIGVCFRGRGEPIAIVQVFSPSKDSVQVVLDVRDAITHKRVSRTLDLRAIPPDARPLAIAIGTDELLIASWVEVAVTDDDPTLPSEVTHVVSEELARGRFAEAGAAFAFESYAGRQKFLGIDARAGLWLVEHLAVTLRFGLRRGFEVKSTNGSVRTDAWLLGVGLRVPLMPPSEMFGLDVQGRADVIYASYVPEAEPGVIARRGEATAIVAWAGIAPTFQPVTRLRIAVEGALGAPLRPIRATDTGDSVSAIEGLAYALGAEVALLF
jgi:hypothetical protein